MIMTNDFPIMLHKYLTNFLPNERGYSENTIKTYRYTFNGIKLKKINTIR